MKHLYEKPVLDVVELNCDDIIKTSETFDGGDVPDDVLDW